MTYNAYVWYIVGKFNTQYKQYQLYLKKCLDVRETKLIKSFNFCKYLIAINRRK